jgi:hypothetical protein
MNKTTSNILFRQLLWTFSLSSISSCFIQTIFFGSHINKWFTMSDVMTLNVLAIIFSLCLTLTSLTTLFNLSTKVRHKKSHLVLSYFLFPFIIILMTLIGIFKLKEKDIYPLDFSTLYISYFIVIVMFFIFHTRSYLKFR